MRHRTYMTVDEIAEHLKISREKAQAFYDARMADWPVDDF